MTHAYFNEIDIAHQLIERWLGDDSAPPEVCDKLIARFHPHYSMIGVAGHALDHAGLCRFFRANGGAKRGLQIEVFDMQLIQEWPNGAIVLYKERQKLDGNVTLRFSTVLLERTGNGEILWRHLHETSTQL